MKRKSFLNHAVQEGVLFLLLSGGLLWYSLDAYRKSFNKDWTQSPSLFPVVVSLLLALFGLIILMQGVREVREGSAASAKGGQPMQVIILLGITLAYYMALSVIKMPYMGVTIFSLTLTLSTFEVVTTVFLLVMMFYLGVRSKPILICVPVCASAFLSIMFRTMLHVLLP